MSKLATLEHLENLARRTKAHLDDKADETATKNYIRAVKEKADGVEFTDGNGNVVYKLYIME